MSNNGKHCYDFTKLVKELSGVEDGLQGRKFLTRQSFLLQYLVIII